MAACGHRDALVVDARELDLDLDFIRRQQLVELIIGLEVDRIQDLELVDGELERRLREIPQGEGAAQFRKPDERPLGLAGSGCRRQPVC